MQLITMFFVWGWIISAIWSRILWYPVIGDQSELCSYTENLYTDLHLHHVCGLWYWRGLKNMVPSIVHTLSTLPCPVLRRYFRILRLCWVRSSCNEYGRFFSFNTLVSVVSCKSHDNWPGFGASLPNLMRSAYVTRGDIYNPGQK